MNKNIIAISVIIMLLIGGYCLYNNSQDKWTGWYYPNGTTSDESTWKMSPTFDTQSECNNWIESIRTKRRRSLVTFATENVYNDTYECGLNCKWDKRWDGYTCEETW